MVITPYQEMSYHSGKILTPVASRKRKERESMFAGTEVIPMTQPAAPSTLTQTAAKPITGNQLLAGYMAYEFLTKGTLLGQRLNPARVEAVGVGPARHRAADPKELKPEAEPNGRKEHGSYGEVASILKTEGAYIPEIVNPTQLAQWIQM